MDKSDALCVQCESPEFKIVVLGSVIVSSGSALLFGRHRILIIFRILVLSVMLEDVPLTFPLAVLSTQVHQIEWTISTAARLPHEQDQLSVYAITSRR